MWLVFKYKKREYNLLIKELKKKFGDFIKFYNPKVACKENKRGKNSDQDYLLKNYAFCYLENFENNRVLSQLNYTKGLEYFLKGYSEQQKQIIEFIDICKKHENEYGLIKSTFFSNLNFSKVKFLGGPFSNIIFDILERNSNNFKMLLGKMKLSVNKKTNYNYSPIY